MSHKDPRTLKQPLFHGSSIRPPGVWLSIAILLPREVDSPEQLGSAREILLAMENAAGVVSILVTGPDKVWEISEKDNVTGDESSMWGGRSWGDATLVFRYTFYKDFPEVFFFHLEL